jgi:hypothetical protein
VVEEDVGVRPYLLHVSEQLLSVDETTQQALFPAKLEYMPGQ